MSALNNGPLTPPPSAKQVTYIQVHAAVHSQPDGGRVLVFSTAYEQVVFPMSKEAAETIGRALIAPGVHVPKPGEMP